MDVEIIIGTAEQALEVEAQIPEFETTRSIEDYEAELSDRKHVILVALANGKPIAFKVAYEQAPGTLFIWTGGVVPEFRSHGVAKEILNYQENWAKENGYNRIDVYTYNAFPSMLKLLITFGYKIVGFYEHINANCSRVDLSKCLVETEEEEQKYWFPI